MSDFRLDVPVLTSFTALQQESEPEVETEKRPFPNLLSEFVYTRSYSRWRYDLNRRETWEETVQRYIDFIASERKVPSHILEEIHRAILRMDVLPSMRALWSAGEAARRDNTAMYNCLARETQFITSEGVRSFEDFEDGDEVTVLTHTGAWKPAVVHSYGEQRLYNIRIARGRSSYVVRATRDHQWILKDGSRTYNLSEKMHLHCPPRLVGAWQYEESDPVARFYWAMGYVYGDGTRVKGPDGEYRYSMVRLCGEDKSRFLERFQELGFSTSTPPSMGGDAIAYTGHYLKTLPSIEEDGFENVVAFVRGYLDADGAKNRNKGPNPFVSIQATGKEAIEFIRRVFPAVGAYITREEDLTGQETKFGVRPETVRFGLVLGFGDSHNSTFSVQRIEEDRFETVWCLTVEDDHSFVLPNGIVTGNCAFVPLDSLPSFSELLYILMMGTGIGYSVERQFISNLPPVASLTGDVATHVVADSTKGWADAFLFGLTNWFRGNKVDFDFSLVRPAGAPLRVKGGRASGPEPLQRLFAFAEETILNAAGRKLRPIEAHDIACMVGEIVMSGGVRRAALISISDVDDEEMRHAKDWSQGDFPKLRYMANNSAFYLERPDRETFNKEWAALVQSGSGERGFLIDNFWRRADRPKGECRINPCVTDDTWVETSEGPVQVRYLVGKPFVAVVDGEEHPSTDVGFWSTGVKTTYRLQTEEGYHLDLTANHEVCRVLDGGQFEWVEAGSLQPGDRIRLNDHRGVAVERENISWKEGWLLGLLFGGATFDERHTGYLTFWGEGSDDQAERVVRYAREIGRTNPKMAYTEEGVPQVSDKSFYGYMEAHGLLPGVHIIPPDVESRKLDFVSGFLCGLFDVHGSVHGGADVGVSVRLYHSDEYTLWAVQRMLLRLGVVSRVRLNQVQAKESDLGGRGALVIRARHVLVVTGDNLSRFLSVVGFKDSMKGDFLEDLIKMYPFGEAGSFVATVTSIDPLGEREVYDCSIPGINAFDANGLYVHNCGEISLRFSRAKDPWTGEGGSGQFCNLSASVMRAEDTVESFAEKVRLASWIGAIQATFTHFPYLRPGWKEVCDEDRLLGVDITGQCDNPRLSRDVEAMTYFNKVARETAAEATAYLGINMPVAITCGKPSGNSSLLVDCASGFHPRHSKFYIRRVRVASTDPLFKLIRDAGVPVFPDNQFADWPEDEVPTWVVEFPVKSPEGAIIRGDESAVDQCNRYLEVVNSWLSERGHNQSATIYVREHEWEEVGEWLWEHFDEVTGLSFLPYDGGKYKLAPYEEITEEQYNEMVASMPDVDFSLLTRYEHEDRGGGAQELACSGGSCEIDYDQEALEAGKIEK